MKSFINGVSFGILISSAVLGCSDLREAEYSSIEAAKAAGAFEGGWLPSPLPVSTHNVREARDLDS